VSTDQDLSRGGPTEAAPRRIRPGCGRDSRVVAIIGAGFSGTMAAIHLRHELPADCVVYLFERSGRFARGPAGGFKGFGAQPFAHIFPGRRHENHRQGCPDERSGEQTGHESARHSI